MAIRNIRVMGDPILEKTCKEVKEMTPRLKELIDDMFDTMYAVSYTHLDVYKRQPPGRYLLSHDQYLEGRQPPAAGHAAVSMK